jgi:hypothetical protein
MPRTGGSDTGRPGLGTGSKSSSELPCMMLANTRVRGVRSAPRSLWFREADDHKRVLTRSSPLIKVEFSQDGATLVSSDRCCRSVSYSIALDSSETGPPTRFLTLLQGLWPRS